MCMYKQSQSSKTGKLNKKQQMYMYIDFNKQTLLLHILTTRSHECNNLDLYQFMVFHQFTNFLGTINRSLNSCKPTNLTIEMYKYINIFQSINSIKCFI